MLATCEPSGFHWELRDGQEVEPPSHTRGLYGTDRSGISVGILSEPGQY